MTPRQHDKQDPRLLVLEGPWDFLSAADKDEVLRTTGPWNRISAGLSMGGCLEQPVGFDLVVTLDQRLNEFDELAPESPTEQIAWSIIDDDWPDLDALVSLVALVDERLARDQQVLVRCIAGLNRSGLVCAAVLVRAGSQPSDAINAVRAARSRHSLCNPQFVELINRMQPGDATLGILG